MPVPNPLSNPARLQALRDTGLLQGPREEAFDRFTRIAARMLNAPIALISLVADDRQFFKSCFGLPEPLATIRQTDISHSICQHVVATGKPLAIADTREHPLTRDESGPRSLGIAAYLGVPLANSAGQVLGSLCVIDIVPRPWSPDLTAILTDLASMVMTLIELRQRERQLHDKEAQLRIALESGGMGVYTLDVERSLVTHDDQMNRIHHLPEGTRELTFQSCIDRVHPEDRPKIDSTLRAAAAGEPGEPLEFRIRIPDGTYRWIRSSIHAISPSKYIGVHTDVTDQHHAQEAVKRSEQEFRSVFELDSVGKAQVDVKTRRFTRINRAYCDIVGYTEAEMLSMTFDQITHPDDMPGNLEMLTKLLNGATSATTEKRYIRKDGQIVWINLHVTVVRDANGRQRHTITTIQDITARKIAERALRESEERFHAFMEHAPVIAFIKDKDGRNIFLNNRLLTTFLLKPSAIGKTDHELFAPEAADAFHAADMRVLAGEPLQNEETVPTPDGVTRNWWVSKFPLTDSAGRRYIAGVALDITALKSAERALLAAKESAEAANTAKSLFLANISHEIRTPLTAILGFAAILENSTSSDEHREFCRTIRRNGEHLLAVINDVLDISKIDAGRMPVNPVPTPLAPLVDDLLRLKRLQAAEKRLSLHLHIPAPLPQLITTDPTRLRQILINLIGNAIKFTDRGRIDLSLQLAGPPDKACLHFIVADTGIGMTVDQIASLFKPFMQADPTHARIYGGAGLGLALSRSFANMLEGEILVSSQPDVGSTFTLVLPVGDIRGVATFGTLGESSSSVTSTFATVPAPSAGSILLAEDSPDIQQLVCAYLKSAGISVDVVEDGHAAVARSIAALHAGHPYDLILMDRQMPSLDGYSATRRLRAAGYTLPIVALTASVMPHERDEGFAAGCDHILTKPIHPESFLPDIARLLARAPIHEVESP